MKILNAFAPLLLLAAGCSTYPDNQYSSTYGTSSPSYSTTPTYSTRPSYSSTTTTSPAYSSGVTQGAAATSRILTDSDRALCGSIRQALDGSPTVAGVSHNIYLDSRNGTVTLTGTVSTEQDRQFIDNVVRNTSGVYSVNDQIQVVGLPTGSADARVYSTPQVLANPNSAGTIFNLHVQGLDEPDRSMAQRILQELRTDTILPSLLPVVNITVSGGVITLEGNVQSERQRHAIDTAVKRASGGNQINNMLQVR